MLVAPCRANSDNERRDSPSLPSPRAESIVFRPRIPVCRWLLALVFLGVSVALAQRIPLPKRSRPPAKFDQETSDLFAGDARERLRGERPTPESLTAATSSDPAPGEDSQTTPAAATFAWSGIISAETLTDEIKAHSSDISHAVRNVRAFRSGGNLETRLRFSVIAAMFGILAEYDGDPRWKEQAPAARDAFASAGRNSKAADDNTFKEARQRSEDLEALIRGGSVELPAPEEKQAIEWDRVAQRPPLMQRLEKALDGRLRPWSADQREFERNRPASVHEAEIIAALAEIIQREYYEYVDDDDYLELCRQLNRHALAARTAAREGDLSTLQMAVGEMAKTCSGCHEDYR